MADLPFSNMQSGLLEPKHLPINESIAAAILDRVRLPAFLVEPNAEVRYSNAAGVAALAHGDVLTQAGNVLCAAHPADNGRLKVAIASACSNGERQTLMLSFFKNPRPQIVAVVPFHDDEPRAESEALVLVQKCEPADEIFACALRQLFRLSAAETAIAAALVSGADIEHIAIMRNSKITTVRTQISAMLLKTRTRRQGELIALFSRICLLP